MILSAVCELVVAFSHWHVNHRGMFLLIRCELLSLSFSSGLFPAALALQRGRDLKCHSEWPPPHLWKFRWRETGARLSLFPSFSAF